MSSRRWLAGLNFGITVVLLAVLFIFVNFISSRRYVRTDLTETKFTALSDQTLQVLKHLREPVGIVVFYQPQTAEGQPNPLYPLLIDLLKEYERHSDTLTITYIDPYRDRATAEQLAKQFDIDRSNLLIVHAGGRHQYISDAELAEFEFSAMDPMSGRFAIKSFMGEAALTSAILSVTQTTQPLVWLTTGHGEKSLDDPQELGFADLKKYLEKATMQAETVTLLEQTEIPDTVKAVIIAGPTRRFTEQEVALLEAYLQRGGRLLALLDPIQETALEDLLSRWGVELGHDIVVDPARQLPYVSAANVFVTTYTKHPIVGKMQTLMTLFPLARSVQPAKDLRDLKVTSLAMTSPQGWGETQVDVQQFQFNESTDTRGPVSLAVAVERPAVEAPAQTDATPAPPATPRTRLVVIGDSDFASNSQLGNVGNLDLALGCLHWLVDQEQLIGIGPKPLESIRLNFTGAQMRQIFWFSFAGLPCLFGLLGVVMWGLRRR